MLFLKVFIASIAQRDRVVIATRRREPKRLVRRTSRDGEPTRHTRRVCHVTESRRDARDVRHVTESRRDARDRRHVTESRRDATRVSRDGEPTCVTRPALREDMSLALVRRATSVNFRLRPATAKLPKCVVRRRRAERSCTGCIARQRLLAAPRSASLRGTRCAVQNYRLQMTHAHTSNFRLRTATGNVFGVRRYAAYTEPWTK